MFVPPSCDGAILSFATVNEDNYFEVLSYLIDTLPNMDASTIYMLVDRKYPLSKDACQVMLKMKLLDGTMDKVCYQLLKMIEKQAGIRNLIIPVLTTFNPPQYSVIHQPPHEKTIGELLAEERAANIDQSPPQEMSIQDMEDLKQHYLDEMKSLINDLQIKDYRNERIDIQYRRECEIKIDELKQNFNGMSIEIRKKEKELLQQEHAAYVRTSQRFNFIYYDDDDDEESSIPLSDVISELPPCVAITPDLPKSDSLIMEDKHLDTIPETESDELIKSSVEDLVHTPSESDGISESECDVPDCDDSQTTNFSTFSNPLFDDSTSSDDESSHEEVIHEISFKTYSNPLFDLDEEIISSEFNPIHNEDLDSTPKNDRFDTESYLLESLLNRDTLMGSSPKIDSLFGDFADNSSPRPPEDFHANPNTIIESLSTFPIPVEDSDSLREEIDIFPGLDDSIPLGIESDDYDSEDSTIDVVEDIPVDVPNILPTHPTLHMDFDFIPSHNDLGSNLDVSSPSEDRNKIYDPGICIEVESIRILATLSLVIDTLLPFSSENEVKVFIHGVLASKEKSPPSSLHQGFKASKLYH
ncbi:hypothetical protein Tco_1346303 [Tanacetum coccineum]